MPFQYKIAAFDLDGTLAESKLPLKENMAEALANLSKISKVAVISGAPFHQFENQFLSSLKINNPEEERKMKKNLILLPTCGSQRFEFNEKDLSWLLTDKEPLHPELRTAAIEILKKIISSGLYDIPPKSEIFGEYIEDRGTQVTLSAWGQKAPLEKKKTWDPDHKKRIKIKEEIEKHISGVSVVIGGTTSVDIVPKDFNKAKGLIRLLDKLGLQKKDMIFVGDAVFPGGNDYSPFEEGIESIQVEGPNETLEVIEKWIGDK